jgi:hypothetical protein
VEIGTEAEQFPEKKYIKNGIFLAVHNTMSEGAYIIKLKREAFLTMRKIIFLHL